MLYRVVDLDLKNNSFHFLLISFHYLNLCVQINTCNHFVELYHYLTLIVLLECRLNHISINTLKENM